LLNNAEDLAAPNSIKQHYPRLPKVIQDAMELTTAIPKKYLWVNRLCIIQDDPQREEEVMRMDQIYSGAYMTIIAAAEHGLYCTPVGTVHNPAIKSPKDWFENSWCRLAPNERILEYYDTVSRSKWAKRAWTYQEYLLSKRVVFFLDTQIFWQCECAVWDKDYFRPGGDDEDESIVSGDSMYSDSGPTSSFSVPTWPDFGLYVDLICPYNGRDLSFSKDGLSACSGILKRLVPAFPNGFLFGLPRIYLDHALLWQPLKADYEIPECAVIRDGIPGRISLPTRRSILPSWAWCGWQCFVDPRSFQAALNLGQDGCYWEDSSSSWKLRSIITWEDVSSSIREPVKVDEAVKNPRNQIPSISSFQAATTHQSRLSTSQISAIVSQAFFFPAATLEIRFQTEWRRRKCSALLSAFANPILSEKNLLERPKVIVLRDPARGFSGLLCITGHSDCKQGEPIELIAISRGSANGEDLKKCFEEKYSQWASIEMQSRFGPYTIATSGGLVFRIRVRLRE
jgi:hypothetical protein